MDSFKDYYKFPLKPMKGLESLKVLTDDNQMAFDWNMKLSIDAINKILSKINNINPDTHTKLELLYIPETCIIYCKGKNSTKPLLRIRGWGHLTGIGGLHLPEEKAKAIQDEFGEYIVKMLNNGNN